MPTDEMQDAYVFVPSGSHETMDKLKYLWWKGDIRYAARVLSGAYGSVAFVEATPDDLGELREKLTRVRDAVNPGTSVGVALKVGRQSPTRWSTKKPVGAYVRIRARAGLAGAVFDAVETMPLGVNYYGAALILGDWDVLLELGADTFAEMKDVLLGLVGSRGVLSGDLVESTDSAIVISDTEKPSGPGEQ
ncbi:MAG: hypothetical protein ACXVAE_05610 [Candidatus Limnocylindrales bacterium]